MRVFALSTGRCGSLTFARACSYLEGYTAGHETRAGLVHDRLAYPDNHIESDHRLTFFLGGLERRYGDAPVYVHLIRDPEDCARSWARRYGVKGGLMGAFANGVLFRPQDGDQLDIARLMVRTVTENIVEFLRTKSKVVPLAIESPHEAFDCLCDLIGVEGGREAAHAELGVRHNAGGHS